MITWLYVLIVGYLLGLVGWNLYRQEKLGDQIIAVLVLIPLLLRFLGIK